MPAPMALTAALHAIMPNTRLVAQPLPLVSTHTPLSLWLIDPKLPTERLADDVVTRLWQNTPYWIFCWASGLALAKYILANPKLVAGKTILDFGAGSGVVAIAAKLAGAKRAIACDIDVMSLAACQQNAALNGVTLELLADVYALAEPIDILFAADVLYDQANRYFLDEFLKFAPQVWVADSRVKNFSHAKYVTQGVYEASTWPDLDEANEFRQVTFYTTHGAL